MSQKLPLKGEHLLHARVMDPFYKKDLTEDDLSYFVDKDPCLLCGATKDQVIGQFRRYKTTDISGLYKDSKGKRRRINQIWRNIGKVDNGCD